MATRAPTTFTTNMINMRNINMLDPVTFTEPEQQCDDQEMILTMGHIIVSDCFYPIAQAVDAKTYYRSYYFVGRHLCGTDADEDCAVSALAWTDDGATQGAIWINGIVPAQERAVAVTASVTSKIWRTWTSGAGLSKIYTDGTENEIQIGIERTAGAGTIYLAGIAIYSVQP